MKLIWRTVLLSLLMVTGVRVVNGESANDALYIGNYDVAKLQEGSRVFESLLQFTSVVVDENLITVRSAFGGEEQTFQYPRTQVRLSACLNKYPSDLLVDLLEHNSNLYLECYEHSYLGSVAGNMLLMTLGAEQYALIALVMSGEKLLYLSKMTA